MQAGQQRPSYEELADLVVAQARVIEQLRVEIAELRADNQRLRAENAELKRRLGMNSTNSSQPPSADGLANRPGSRYGARPGASLAGRPDIRDQLFDLPEIAVRVTEHQVVARRCGCGTVTCGLAPMPVG